MKPLITVVTPSYNSMTTIFTTIDSLLEQSYPQIQYIIADDKSENFCCKTITDYINKNNKGNIVDFAVFQNDENLGISKNLNQALSLAKGKYLFNIAADDAFYDSAVLEEWVQQFENSNAQVITGLRAVYDENLEKELYIAPTKNEIEILTNSSPQQLFEEMSGFNIVFGCCTARTKENYEWLNGYDEQYKLIEDYPANLKTLRNGTPIVFWNRTVIKYRKGGISACGGLSKEYLFESDRIFQQEALPYSNNKKSAKHSYKLWKNEAIYNADKSKLINKMHLEKSLTTKILVHFLLLFMHPITSFIIIKNKIFRR